jgi:transcription elongation factor Elf1
VFTKIKRFLRAIEQADARRLARWEAEKRKSSMPKCPFCHHREYTVVRPATLVNSRIKTARVRMGVRCNNCGMRMTASRPHYSTRWTFWESD